MKNKGVSMKVDESFYKAIQKARLNYKLKYGIRIKSDKQLTKCLSDNPKFFYNKSLIKRMRGLKI